MADTTYLTRIVEPHLIKWVAQKIGIQLTKKTLVVGEKRTGDAVSFEIDGVSANCKVGVFASAAGTIKAGQELKLFRDAAVLLRVPFDRRIMVFVERDVWTGFDNRCDGLLDLKLIEPMFCDGIDLPADMRDRIGQIRREARDEVGDRRKPVRIPGARG